MNTFLEFTFFSLTVVGVIALSVCGAQWIRRFASRTSCAAALVVHTPKFCL